VVNNDNKGEDENETRKRFRRCACLPGTRR
jgi:hypothetical protein